MAKLEEGESYLSIQILGNIHLAAFANKDKVEGSNAPDFKGDGVAVWITTKKAAKKVESSNPFQKLR